MSSLINSTVIYSREGVATTAAVDLFEFTVAAAYPGVRVAGLHISQSSDLGDAAEEIIRYRFVYGNTTSGSGGAAPDESLGGFPFAEPPVSGIESFNTTAATGGTAEPGVPGSFNIRAGEAMWYPPGTEPRLKADDGGGEVNVVRLQAAPADSLTMTAAIWLYG